MNILFIGGSGNISYPCAARCVATGHSVTCLTRGKSPIPSGCTALIADYRDYRPLSRAVGDRRFDAIVNFLAYSPSDLKRDYELFGGKTGQHIFISSATVYRKPHQHLPLTEVCELGNPFSEYARNKQACEEYLRGVWHPTFFPGTIIRPSHTFGNTWIPSPLNGSADFTVAARIRSSKPVVVHGDGQTRWALTPANDFAVALERVIGNARSIGEAFHITSDETLTWNEITAAIGSALGVAPRIVHIPIDFLCEQTPELSDKLKGDKAEEGVFDNSKIKALAPGFTCRPFAKAIAESVAWFDTDPNRKTVNPAQNDLIETWIRSWEQTRRGC